MSETSATPSAPAKKRTGPFTFIAQVQQEGKKVTWTTRKETVAATIMVVIMVTVASLFFFAVDSLLSWGIPLATGIQGGN